MVTRSFPNAGVYSSGIPAMPSADWRRAIARFRHLDELARRVNELETRLEAMKQTTGPEAS
jgi:UDP-3-O-[3-hydroxymyristoyl] glucosamine N-acyltransferase